MKTNVINIGTWKAAHLKQMLALSLKRVRAERDTQDEEA